uniref:Phlebovirus glycoprotein G2 fusion domain-containing protein n=1 Tax=Heterorhabditis bacteriophora TaxID=37862 RepID=A0A1I7WK87_HETBA
MLSITVVVLSSFVACGILSFLPLLLYSTIPSNNGILGTEHSISTVTPNITNLNEISIFPTPCVNVTAGNSQSSYKPCNVSETEHSKSITTLGISQSKEMGILPNASKTPSVNTVLPNKPCGILGNEHIITTDVPVISKLNEVEIFSTPNIQKEINQSCTVFIHAIEVNISCNCQKADDKLECPCKQAETGENHIPCSAVNRTIIIRNGRFNGNGGPISCAKAVQLGIISEVDIPKSCTTSYMTGALKGNGENNHISSDELVIPTGQSVTLIVDDTSVYTVESSSVAFSIFSTLPFIIITSLLIPQKSKFPKPRKYKSTIKRQYSSSSSWACTPAKRNERDNERIGKY